MSRSRMKVAGLVAVFLMCLVVAAAGFSGCSRPPTFVEGYVAAGTGQYSTVTIFPVKQAADLPRPDHPIAGATVSILKPDGKKAEYSSSSRPEGSFYVGSGGMSDTPGNVHILRVEAPGYVPVEVPVVLDRSAYVIVTLVPEGQAPDGAGVPVP